MNSLLLRLLPQSNSVSLVERLRASSGALLGILLLALLALVLGSFVSRPLLIAPFGASAVLLFAVPASPLAQPWPVIGGNGIAAVIGVLCAILIPIPAVAAAVALGVTIFALLFFRCLHPPSGAVALTAVLGGTAIHDQGFAFVLWPVLAGSAGLVLVAIIFNSATGRRYPHVHVRQALPVGPRDAGRLEVTREDVVAAILERDEVVPVDPEDIEEVMERAEILALRRRSTGVVAAKIMTSGVARVAPETPLRLALQMLRTQHVKALPVVNAQRQVVGIVTQTDLLDKADWGPAADGPVHGWRPRLTGKSDRPLGGKTADVMTTSVRAVRLDTPLAHVMDVMADTGHHHLPVVDTDGALAGMITQSDVVSALWRGAPGASAGSQPAVTPAA